MPLGERRERFKEKLGVGFNLVGNQHTANQSDDGGGSGGGEGGEYIGNKEEIETLENMGRRNGWRIRGERRDSVNWKRSPNNALLRPTGNVWMENNKPVIAHWSTDENMKIEINKQQEPKYLDAMAELGV